MRAIPQLALEGPAQRLDRQALARAVEACDVAGIEAALQPIVPIGARASVLRGFGPVARAFLMEVTIDLRLEFSEAVVRRLVDHAIEPRWAEGPGPDQDAPDARFDRVVSVSRLDPGSLGALIGPVRLALSRLSRFGTHVLEGAALTSRFEGPTREVVRSVRDHLALLEGVRLLQRDLHLYDPASWRCAGDLAHRPRLLVGYLQSQVPATRLLFRPDESLLRDAFATGSKWEQAMVKAMLERLEVPALARLADRAASPDDPLARHRDERLRERIGEALAKGRESDVVEALKVIARRPELTSPEDVMAALGSAGPLLHGLALAAYPQVGTDELRRFHRWCVEVMEPVAARTALDRLLLDPDPDSLRFLESHRRARAAVAGKLGPTHLDAAVTRMRSALAAHVGRISIAATAGELSLCAIEGGELSVVADHPRGARDEAARRTSTSWWNPVDWFLALVRRFARALTPGSPATAPRITPRPDEPAPPVGYADDGDLPHPGR